MNGDRHGHSPPDPKHFVKLSPEAVTLRNNILMSSSFIAVISTFLSFSTMRKQTQEFESSTVPALTEQPKDFVGLSFIVSGHTQYNFFLRYHTSNKRCECLSCRKILSSSTRLKWTKVWTTRDKNKHIISASALNQNQTESERVCDKKHQVKPPSLQTTACNLLQPCFTLFSTKYQDLRSSQWFCISQLRSICQKASAQFFF